MQRAAPCGMECIARKGMDYTSAMPTPPPRSCTTCRHFDYQECYVAGVWRMQTHCGSWYKCFPDANQCADYEREPGSDDESSNLAISVEV